MSIRSIKAQDIPMIASAMAGRNAVAKERCGFIGSDPTQIAEYLSEIYQDGGSILISRDAMAAGDVVDDNRSVEVIGPYGDSVLAVREMIEELRYRHPSYDLLFFVDAENSHVLEALAGAEASREEHWEMVRELEPGEPDPDIRFFRRGEFIAKLHDELFPRAYYSGKSLEDMALSGHGKLAVFRQEQVILGYIFYQTHPAYIDFLGVSEAARNTGIGTRLLNHACQDAWEQGDRTIAMAVRKANAAGTSFMQKHGFEIAEANISIRLRG